MRRTAHPREELAALALGALEPGEAADVRAHVEGCEACRAELRRFEALPPLLDLAGDYEARAAVAPPPAALEGAVLAQIEHARQTAPRPSAAPRRRRRFALGGPAWGLAGAALAVAVLAVTGALGGGGNGPDTERVVALHGPVGAAQATLTPVASGTRVDLRVSDVPATRGQQVYELWFSRGRDRVSAGTFRVGADGSATADLTVAVDERDAQRLWITREPDGDDPRPNGPTVLKTKLTRA